MAKLESLIEPFGVSFVYSIPPTALRRMEREIAEAAVTEVLTRMIAEIGFYTTALYQYDTTFEAPTMSEGISVEELIRSYLPTPAPTADEGETDHE